MKSYVPILAMVAVVWASFTPIVGAAPPPSYSATLPDSAFETGNAGEAVRMLLRENVPVSVIVQAAMRNGIAADELVGAMLAAGLPGQDVILHCMRGPMPARDALAALKHHGISPDTVLFYLVLWNLASDTIYETCNYMLRQGYTKADVLRKLLEADADRATILQVVRWFNIPPATIVALLQSLDLSLERFGHVFTRHEMPQPALIAIGVSRINASSTFQGPIISPMRP